MVLLQPSARYDQARKRPHGRPSPRLPSSHDTRGQAGDSVGSPKGPACVVVGDLGDEKLPEASFGFRLTGKDGGHMRGGEGKGGDLGSGHRRTNKRIPATHDTKTKST